MATLGTDESGQHCREVNNTRVNVWTVQKSGHCEEVISGGLTVLIFHSCFLAVLATLEFIKKKVYV